MELKNDETLVKEFDNYLTKIHGIGTAARGNYLSWTRFLMKSHDLTQIHTKDDVDHILQMEEMMMTSPKRKVYRTKRDLVNFHSTLYNFLPFITSFRKAQEAKRSNISIDAMIDLIAKQPGKAQAETVGEAIILLGYNMNYAFSDAQKQRITASLSKYDSTIHVDKFFAPGANYYPSL